MILCGGRTFRTAGLRSGPQLWRRRSGVADSTRHPLPAAGRRRTGGGDGAPAPAARRSESGFGSGRSRTREVEDRRGRGCGFFEESHVPRTVEPYDAGLRGVRRRSPRRVRPGCSRPHGRRRRAGVRATCAASRCGRGVRTCRAQQATMPLSSVTKTCSARSATASAMRVRFSAANPAAGAVRGQQLLFPASTSAISRSRPPSSRRCPRRASS